MSRRIGELWVALGVLHFLIILMMGWSEVSEIVGDGFLNAVGGDPRRCAVFWLFYLGAPTILMGLLIRWTQRQLGRLPEFLGWACLVAFGFGLVAVPASGFWLGVLLAGYMVVVARRQAPPARSQLNY